MEEKEHKKTSKYEWTEYDGEDLEGTCEDMTVEELEQSINELKKRLFGDKKKDKK
ncbi:hypothetical protein [Thomasclavelia cocleata]|uniref:hypothetical protein n=1 Tax=Thomasclavelia cocleata TaxID=69824 RepID=UPI002570FEC0|nr:hypothetical protein [Thomasclavelia cocleata]